MNDNVGYIPEPEPGFDAAGWYFLDLRGDSHGPFSSEAAATEAWARHDAAEAAAYEAYLAKVRADSAAERNAFIDGLQGA